MANKLILMSGYPGSGKSTLAARLAGQLGLPLVSKDAILIEIFNALSLSIGETQVAGKAAWAVFWHMARSFPRAVLDTNIKPRSPLERAELAKLDAQIVEVRCVCPIELAMRRYAERGATGHPAQRFHQPSTELFAEYDGPIGVGALIESDTAKMPDIDDIVRRIERHFA